MRQMVPFGFVIGGIALSVLGLWGMLLILQAKSRCEAGLASCVTLGPFYPLVLASGVALTLAGALLVRRARQASSPRA